jgi:hypothetical protein
MSVSGNHLPRPRPGRPIASGYTAASRERLFAIMLMSYEAELHSQAGCARRTGREELFGPQCSICAYSA